MRTPPDQEVEVAAAKPALRRVLGTPLLILYGLGIIIGAGIYVLVGSVVGGGGHTGALVVRPRRHPRNADRVVICRTGCPVP
jgi:amino acid permease